jgi:hypothetical protein
MKPSHKEPVNFIPVPLRPRHDGWTAERQIAFIEALAETACVEEACRRVGMSDSSAYSLRRRPKGTLVREAWAAAFDNFVLSYSSRLVLRFARLFDPFTTSGHSAFPRGRPISF